MGNGSTEMVHPESVSAMASMPRDMAIIKMENDNIMSLAASRPRDHAAVLADIKTQLATYRSFAEEAMYAKPVGRMETCPNCGEENKYYKDQCFKCHKPIPMKIARGLSVRAAEAIAAAYKYNSSHVSVTDLDADKVNVEAAFVDYQDGRIWRKSTIMSKTFKKRDGSTGRINDDRFYNVIVPARQSILIRDCITRVVPPGLRSDLEAEVDKQLDSFLDEETVKKIIAQFSQKNVSPAMLENFIGKKLAAFTKDDRKALVGAWTALKDGETTVAELFGEEPKEPPKEPQRKQPEPKADQGATEVPSGRGTENPGEKGAVPAEAPSSDDALKGNVGEEPAPIEDDTGSREALGDEPECIVYVPLKDVKNKPVGTVLATAGKVKSVKDRPGNSPAQDVVIFQGASTLPVTHFGSRPNWLKNDVTIDIAELKIHESASKQIYYNVKQWQPRDWNG